MPNYLAYLRSIQSPQNFHRKIDYLKYNFSKFIKNKKISVLEIGPGLGEFVSYLNYNGINNIDIIDQDKSILENIKNNFKIKSIFLGDISSINLKNNYDVIFMLQVLEHIPKQNLPNLLTSLYSHLNNNGKIIITVPNGGNLFGLVERYSDLTHTTLFTENSLKELPNFCNLPGSVTTLIQPYSIPPYSLINIIRVILQKIIHLFILIISILNGGVYSKILTPNITLVITKNK